MEQPDVIQLPGNGKKQALEFRHPPRRVVSLVPSLTESLFELGFGEAVVGVTDYCLRPEGKLEGIPRVGGPKNPKLASILALKPDLVLANQEENTPQIVEALEEQGVKVWVSFPQSVRQSLDVLWTLVGIFRDKRAVVRLETLEIAVDWAQASQEGNPRLTYFCPIWQDRTRRGQRWWMTINEHTYAHDVLALAGGQNVFARRERRYPLSADLGNGEAQDPGEKDVRYPRVTRQEILDADPQIVLLPSEPFTFGERDMAEFQELFAATQACRRGKVFLVDGSLITWHGTHLAQALQELPVLFTV